MINSSMQWIFKQDFVGSVLQTRPSSAAKAATAQFALSWSLSWGCWSYHMGPGQWRRCPRAWLLRATVCAAFSKPGAGWSRWELWREKYSIKITTSFLADVAGESSVKLLKIMLSGCFGPWAPWIMQKTKEAEKFIGRRPEVPWAVLNINPRVAWILLRVCY